MEALDEIPGVGVRTIQEVIAEIGTDMSRFLLQLTYHLGPRSVLATMNLGASERVHLLDGAVLGSAPHWLKRLGLPQAPRILTLQCYIVVSQPVEEVNAPYWL